MRYALCVMGYELSIYAYELINTRRIAVARRCQSRSDPWARLLHSRFQGLALYEVEEVLCSLPK